MINIKTVKKLGCVERELAEERGGIFLFAVWLRPESPDLWDVVVSADWLKRGGKDDSMKVIVDRIRAKLTNAEMIMLSHVRLLEPTHPMVVDANRIVQVQHGCTEMFSFDIGDVDIKHAFFITSEKPKPVRARRKKACA